MVTENGHARGYSNTMPMKVPSTAVVSDPVLSLGSCWMLASSQLILVVNRI